MINISRLLMLPPVVCALSLVMIFSNIKLVKAIPIEIIKSPVVLPPRTITIQGQITSGHGFSEVPCGLIYVRLEETQLLNEEIEGLVGGFFRERKTVRAEAQSTGDASNCRYKLTFIEKNVMGTKSLRYPKPRYSEIYSTSSHYSGRYRYPMPDVVYPENQNIDLKVYSTVIP